MDIKIQKAAENKRLKDENTEQREEIAELKAIIQNLRNKKPVVTSQSIEIQTETVMNNSIEIQCDNIQQQIGDVYINEDIHKLHGFLFELLSKIAKNEKYAAYVEKNENNVRLKKVLSLAKINKINNKIQMKEEELKTVTKQ